MKPLAVLTLVLMLPWTTTFAADDHPRVGPAPGDATAGTAAELPLDLAGAVRRARQNSPRLRALESLRLAAEHEMDESRAAKLPSLDATADYTRRSSVPELTIPIGGVMRTIFPDIHDNWAARVEAWFPLYTGGGTRGSIDAARSRRDAAIDDVAAGDVELAFETRQAYWALTTALETERVLQAALASFDAHVQDARNRERFGFAAHDEVLAVEVQRDRAELARLRAENLTKTIRADLASLLDLPEDTIVVPIEPLRDTGPGSSDETRDVETLVTEALSHRPDRAALSARISAGEAVERTERSGGRPHVALAAGYDYARPNRIIVPPENQWDDSWDVSVRVSMRLFDGGRTRAASAAAAARTEALRQQRDDMDRRIRRDVTSRLLDLHTASLAVSVAEANVASAAESLRISRDRYREGVIPSSELLDAERARLDADLDLTRVLAGVRQARAALDRAVGR